MCAEVYAFFLKSLGVDSNYPPGGPELSDNGLSGMFCAHTPPHNKEVILNSMQNADGVVRTVFTTVALGVGVNFIGLNLVVYYGALSSIFKRAEEWID